MRSLFRALVIFVALGCATDGTAGAAPVAHRNLLDYARAKSAALRASGRVPSLARYAPSAVMTSQAARFLWRPAFPGAYLLYVSRITPSGAGFVNVYPGWVPGTHPPLVGQISGLDSPSSLAVDRFGTLYVCQTDVGAPVLVFPFLSREPARRLDTEGTLPVSVAVAPSGTVFVATAQNAGDAASILVYPPGATAPSLRLGGLAGDAVASLQSDDRGNAYWSADYIDAPGYIGEVEKRALHRIVDFADDTQVTQIELDAAGNVLALGDDGSLITYARASGARLVSLHVPVSQSLSFGSDHHSFYTASGTISRYDYPSGRLVTTIESLAADDTFGLATYPRAPYARGN